MKKHSYSPLGILPGCATGKGLAVVADTARNANAKELPMAATIFHPTSNSTWTGNVVRDWLVFHSVVQLYNKEITFTTQIVSREPIIEKLQDLYSSSDAVN